MKALDHLEFTQGVRCFNGAYDSASQRVLDNREAVLKAIREVEPEAHCSYYAVAPCDSPDHEVYMVHVWGRPLSGYHKSKAAALTEAYHNTHKET